DPDAVDQLLEVTADVLDRVRHERPDLNGKVGLGLDHRAGDGGGGLDGPLRSDRLADVERVAVQAGRAPVPDLVEDVGTDVVDQRDARLDQQLRTEIRVPAGHAGRRVDNGDDVAGQQ